MLSPSGPENTSSPSITAARVPSNDPLGGWISRSSPDRRSICRTAVTGAVPISPSAETVMYRSRPDTRQACSARPVGTCHTGLPVALL